MFNNTKPIALVTGVSREIGIGSSIVKKLSSNGWDIAFTYWSPYDSSMEWGSNPVEIDNLKKELVSKGTKVCSIEADLSLTSTPKEIFEFAEEKLGKISALIMSHCHSVDSDINSTTIESFDKHFAINTRACWLLIKEFSNRGNFECDKGRIIGITSDHTAWNMPYGASKGAMDRIIIAASKELADKNITSNVINPGATDTGWIGEDMKKIILDSSIKKRIGEPQDCANLVNFLCTEEGSWINGQILYSNGGLK